MRPILLQACDLTTATSHTHVSQQPQPSRGVAICQESPVDLIPS